MQSHERGPDHPEGKHTSQAVLGFYLNAEMQIRNMLQALLVCGLAASTLKTSPPAPEALCYEAHGIVKTLKTLFRAKVGARRPEVTITTTTTTTPTNSKTIHIVIIIIIMITIMITITIIVIIMIILLILLILLLPTTTTTNNNNDNNTNNNGNNDNNDNDNDNNTNNDNDNDDKHTTTNSNKRKVGACGHDENRRWGILISYGVED